MLNPGVWKNCIILHEILFVSGKEFLQKEGIPKNIVSSDKFECIRSAELRMKECYENSVTARALIKELSDIWLGLSETVRTEAVPWFEAKCESLELEAQ
jgi:hypothetical protein